MADQLQQIIAGLGRLSALGRAGLWQAGAPFGLNPAQAEMLARIVQRPQRAADLAAHLGVSPASASDTVAALVAKGLAERAADPDDRRARLLCATPRGREVAAGIPAAPPALTDAIAALSAADRAQMLASLQRLIRSLQEAGAIPVQRMCATCRFFRPHVHGDAARPHHCDFVNAAFGPAELRLDCGEHELAPATQAVANWQRLDTACA
jgi:DNA-binding MarR family transcriptional regulator